MGEQQERYGHFRRVNFFEKFKNRSAIEFISRLTSNYCRFENIERNLDTSLLILGSATKIFVARLIENARLDADRRQDEGPILPLHIEEAYFELQKTPLLTKLLSSFEP